MAEERYRIEIPIDIQDNTEPALGQAERKVTQFERSTARTKQQLDRMNRTKWQLALSAIDRATPVLRSISTTARSIVGRTWSFTLTAIDRVTAPIRSMIGAVSKLLGIAGLASTVMAGISVNRSLQAFAEQQQAQTQLRVSAVNMGIDEAGIDRIVAKAEAMSRDLMFTDVSLIGAAGEFATYFESAEAITKMMDTVVDYAAGMSGGAQVSTMQMIDYATNLAKMTVGAYDAMTKKGFEVTDAQKRILDRGTEMQKVAIIASIIEENWAGMAEEMSRTPTGALEKMKNRWGDIATEIGKRLTPAFGRFYSAVTARMPQIQRVLTGVAESGASFFDRLIPSIGQWIDAGVERLDRFHAKVTQMVNSQAWRDATTFGEKVKIAWDTLVVTPFETWWNSGGEQQVQEVAAKIGSSLGGAIGGFIATALGVMAEPDPLSGGKESPFVQAGATAGRSFLTAFLDAFDASLIAGKAAAAFRNVVKETGKLAPGGETPTPMSWLGAAGLGWLGSKVVPPIFRAGRWLIGAGGRLMSRGAAGGAAAATTTSRVAAPVIEAAAQAAPAIGTAAKATQLVDQFGKPLVMAERAAASSSKGAGVLAQLSRSPLLKGAGRVVGKAALPLAIGLEGLHIVTAKPGAERAGATGEAIGGISGWLGGAAAGAALGSVVPVIGTAIGGIAGGIIGGLGGGWLGERAGKGIYGARVAAAERQVEVAQAAAPTTAVAAVTVAGFGQAAIATLQAMMLSPQPMVGVTGVGATGPLMTVARAMPTTTMMSQPSMTELANDVIRSLTSGITRGMRAIESGAATAAAAVGRALVDGFRRAANQPTTTMVPQRSILPSLFAIPHADGGIIGRPHLGLVGEAGPEAIVPLSSARRTRGIEVWEQAGRMLGAVPHAEGGIVGRAHFVPMPMRIGDLHDNTQADAEFAVSGINSLSPARGSSVVVELQVAASPQYQIDTTADADGVLRVIRSHQREIANQLGDEIATSIAKAWHNMP